jgi:hypothetical protein
VTHADAPFAGGAVPVVMPEPANVEPTPQLLEGTGAPPVVPGQEDLLGRRIAAALIDILVLTGVDRLLRNRATTPRHAGLRQHQMTHRTDRGDSEPRRYGATSESSDMTPIGLLPVRDDQSRTTKNSEAYNAHMSRRPLAPGQPPPPRQRS